MKRAIFGINRVLPLILLLLLIFLLRLGREILSLARAEAITRTKAETGHMRNLEGEREGWEG